MPSSVTFTCPIDADGNMPRARWIWLRDQVRLFAGGKVTFTVRRPTRSTAANAFYHAAIIGPIRLALLEAGHPVSHDALHEHFRDKYLGVTVEHAGPWEIVRRPSTRKLDQTEFSDFIERVKNDEMVLSLGVYFEEPSERLEGRLADLPY
jgi:hypothetical protein